MKYALKKWWNYLIGFSGYLVAMGIAIIPRVLLIKNDSLTYNWPSEWVSYVLFFSGVVFALIGFVIQDVYRARIRQKINDWDNDLPDENINIAWMIFLPFLIAAALSLATGLLFMIPALKF